jgi:hypothetical protein
MRSVRFWFVMALIAYPGCLSAAVVRLEIAQRTGYGSAVKLGTNKPKYGDLGAAQRATFGSEVKLSINKQEFPDVGLVGYVGDAVELEPGEYTFRLAYAEFVLSFDVTVAGSKVSVSNPRGGVPCDVDTSRKVEAWAVTSRVEGDLVVIEMPEPTFKPLGYSTRMSCSLSLWNVLRNVTANVQSSPIGADIIVEGTVVTTTNRKITVPIRHEPDGAYVIVRKSGYASCVRHVPANVADITIQCSLRRFESIGKK